VVGVSDTTRWALYLFAAYTILQAVLLPSSRRQPRGRHNNERSDRA
jgi:hypothetical protein